jgi:hypothetical protein
VKPHLFGALALLLIGTSLAYGGAQCTDGKPFREVAQDEIKTFVELCSELEMEKADVVATRSATSGERQSRLHAREAARRLPR